LQDFIDLPVWGGQYDNMKFGNVPFAVVH